jgi:DhnA family fructose-bisphosphate aldolase class Ia
MKVGCSGIAIGRNIWQAGKPLEKTRKIKKIIFGK